MEHFVEFFRGKESERYARFFQRNVFFVRLFSGFCSVFVSDIGADGVPDIMILGIPVGDIVGITAGDTDPVGDMAGGTGILLAITDLCTTEEGMEVA